MEYTTPLPNPLDNSSTGTAVTSLLKYSNDTGISPTTVRMQVTFESSIFDAHTTFENKKRARQRKLTDTIIQVEDVVHNAHTAMQLTNSNAPTASGTTSSVDIGELAGIQRLLLDYCNAYTSFDSAASGIKPAVALPLLDFLSSTQKELVNALDSVFPRSAIRQFAETTSEDRINQMNEAARLVFGIRLYNFDANKGGKGMEHVPSKGLQECLTLVKELELFINHANELASHYVDVLNVVNHNELTSIPNITPEVINLWLVELINRRQAITFCAMILDEVKNYANILDSSLLRYNNELNDLKRTVSTSKTVSKDTVYPRFRAMADAWLLSAEIRDAVMHTSSVVGSMRTFFANSHCSLTPASIRAARLVINNSPVDKYTFTPSAPSASSTPAELVSFSAGEDVGLALQGYCPVSLSTALIAASGKSSLGILREGSPAAGVAQYKGRYYLCSSVEAMKCFLLNPDHYLTQILTLAKQYWELVHVLQLTYPSNNTDDNVTNSFMDASLPALVQTHGDIQAASALQSSRSTTTAAPESGTTNTGSTPSAPVDPSTMTTNSNTGPRVNKKGVAVADAAVATPVHFIERYIDPKYEFSEWALRRRAVQIANLRQCSTHSIQTDASHFRRDNDTQVYVPRETGTQTGINMGTNTDRTMQFVVGIRGAPEPFVEQAKANKIAGKPALPSSNAPRMEGPINSRVIQETLNG